MTDPAPHSSGLQLVPNWRQAHKFATTWVTAFWSAFGAILTLYPFFMDSLPVPMWLAGLLFIAASITYGIARFTNQPGLE